MGFAKFRVKFAEPAKLLYKDLEVIRNDIVDGSQFCVSVILIRVPSEISAKARLAHERG